MEEKEEGKKKVQSSAFAFVVHLASTWNREEDEDEDEDKEIHVDCEGWILWGSRLFTCIIIIIIIIIITIIIIINIIIICMKATIIGTY